MVLKDLNKIFKAFGFGHKGGKCHRSDSEKGHKGDGKCRRSESAKEQGKCRSESVQPKCRRSKSPHGKCRRSQSQIPGEKRNRSGSKCHRRKHERRQKSECAAEFIQDVNFPDGSVIAPGTSLIKQWRLKNTGSVKWPEGSKLIFLRGNRELLGEREEFDVPSAEPGESVDVSCPITVPVKAGKYTAYFKLADKDRAVFFGRRFWIEFVVKDDEKEIKATAPVVKKTTESKKEVIEVAEVKETKAKVAQGINSTIPISIPSPPAEVTKYGSSLGVLEKMGFVNEKLNSSLLDRAQGNVEQVVSWLLEMENSVQH